MQGRMELAHNVTSEVVRQRQSSMSGTATRHWQGSSMHGKAASMYSKKKLLFLISMVKDHLVFMTKISCNFVQKVFVVSSYLPSMTTDSATHT